MKKQMSLEEHLVIAERMLDLIDEATETAGYVSMIIGKSKRISNKLYKICDLLGEARSLLDDEYHKVADNGDFKKYGFIYYDSYINPDQLLRVYVPEEKKNV